MEALDRLVEALEAEGLNVDRNGDHVQAQCPTHADEDPSLSIDARDETLLIYCHAGCDTGKVIGALGLSWRDLGVVERQVAEYIYADEAGRPLYRKIRMDPKRFYQERREGSEWLQGLGNTRRVLYRLPDLIKTPEGSTVYIVEGEKDVERIISLGHRATTAGAVSGWQDEFTPFFHPFHVIVIPDRDDAGRRNADAIRLSLLGKTKSVQILWPQAGKDISDHLDAGLDFGELHTYEPAEEDLSPLEPFDDWDTYAGTNYEWLLEPYILKGGRILAYGAAGSLKSLWAMWVAAHLSGEGHRVAYLSLEMTKQMTADRMKQLSHAINKKNFRLLLNLDFSVDEHVELIRRGLRGFDLIVVDSWTAAKPIGMSNEDVAWMDNHILQPITADTGAALLILDNTGHDVHTDEGTFKMKRARGASAKEDKFDITLFFERPYEDNKYRTTLSVNKMRPHHDGAKPLTIQTVRDRIEFFEVNSEGIVDGDPVWPSMKVNPNPSDRLATQGEKMKPFERKFYESQADQQLGRMTAEELAELAGVDPETLKGYDIGRT